MEEVSKQINMSVKEILELKKLLIYSASLSNPVNTNNNYENKFGMLLDFIINEKATNPEKK